MTEPTEGIEVRPGNEGPATAVPASGGRARRLMRKPRAVVAVLCVALVATVLTVVGMTASASSPQATPSANPHATPPVATVSLVSKAYTPQAASGTTDDYHCTLVNPHVTRNSYVISSQFHPGSVEDHHAVLALVPPSLAAQAERDNAGDKGWSCFGAPSLPGASLAQFLSTPFLSVWAPGHGADVLPKGTGIVFLPGAW